MKKLSLLGNLALVLGFAIMVVSCQKQQDAVATTTATDAAVIKNISGSGSSYTGKISRKDAEEMYQTYKSKSGSGSTEYVAFKIADLKAFLASVEAKGKTDDIFVNLAVYDSKTAPDAELVGRTTIFFSPGLPRSSSRDNRYTGFGGVVIFDDNADYMNHGQIWP
jgi:hypothetical protein